MTRPVAVGRRIGRRATEHALATESKAVDTPQTTGGTFLGSIVGDLGNWSRLLMIVVTAVIGVDIVVLRRLILPEKFYFDADTIQRIAQGRSSSLGDDSFGNVADVYRFFGLQSNATLAGLVGYALALAVVGLVLARVRWRANWTGTAAVMLTVLMSAVYLGMYSKDVLVLLVVALVLLLPANLVGECVAVLGLLAYAEFFRTYWFLVAALFIVFRLGVRLLKRRWILLIAPSVALLVLAFVMPLVLGQPSDFARSQINEYRLGSENASTAITPFLSLVEPWGSLLNTQLVLGSILLPVPLVVRGQLYYIASAAIFIAMWALLLARARHVPRQDKLMRSLVFVAAFVTVQALFEPDYGSVLRHLTPLLPLFCAVALRAPARAPRDAKLV